MADLKGLKRICMSCGARFYDLNKKPIVCPSCSTEFTGEIKVKSRRGRLPAEMDESQVDEDVEVEKEEEDVEEIEEDDETVSLEDLDEDNDDVDEDDDELSDLEDDLDELEDGLDDIDDDLDEDIAEDEDED